MGTLRARARVGITARTLERRLTWMLGSPRSGTTWLASLLARSIDAVLIDEPLIGAHLAVQMSSVSSVPDPADLMVHQASSRRRDYVFSDETAWVWRPRLRALLLDRFAAGIVDSGRRTRAPVVIKEPNGALAASMLLQILPRSRLLFVVRDGRDVVDSMIDGASGGWISETHGVTLSRDDRHAFLERRAHHWVHTMQAVSASYASHREELRLRVRYEDLLEDPVWQLERIVRWLGRPFDEETATGAVTDLSFGNIPPGSRGPGLFARAATPGLWRSRFTDDEKQALHRIMGPTLAELGYDPS
jgi:Sulfotransferase family